jgi:hypothetical protein
VSTIDTGQARFMGRITAGATHELRNVLAIIRESAGLIEDLLALAEERHEQPDPERLRRTLSRIDAQVGRGSDLITALNQFAHCPDRDQASVDLFAAIQLATSLSERFVRQKGHRVEAAAGGGTVAATTSPLGLQLTLFAIIDCVAELLPAGSELCLTAREEAGTPIAELEYRCGGEGRDLDLSGAARWSEIEELASEIGGRVESQSGAARLLLPAS